MSETFVDFTEEVRTEERNDHRLLLPLDSKIRRALLHFAVEILSLKIPLLFFVFFVVNTP
jgi:hypothetical protein